ncbi:MAG: hypothetical protein WC372_01550 [Candidatus Neomarinimicrobiota bacterium]|jgi:hypothetical protein|nr:hypothetical protein [Candidatus Neomarinimicrobiota bacterium]MDX9779972.1 hypothetical protein [bacterium]
MLKAILYKEWIKLRWAVIVIAGLSLLTLAYSIGMINYYIEFQGALNNWLYVIGKSLLLRNIVFVKYLPLITGLTFGLLQFVQEMSRNRMRLSYHLPISEKKLLLSSVGIGYAFLLAEIVFLFFGLWLVVAVNYPAEIVQKALLSMIPWFLGGSAVYFLTSFIILEPSWIYRIIYGIVSAGLTSLYFQASTYDQYRTLWTFVLIVLLIPLTILFAGHRFRRGTK